MIHLDEDQWVRRRADVVASPVLTALAHRLGRALDPLRHRSVYFPDEKGSLTRRGGVCPADGTRLLFHPLHPHEHRCPQCRRTVTGALHDQAWIWRYHLWLSERAIHAALLHRLGFADDGQMLATEILAMYAAAYRDFPNRDNVLGPARLFFSTYLESIWLLQVTTAIGLLEGGAPGVRAVRLQLEPVIEESADLIGSFDEGFSNRQVWNNAALAAAGRFLGRDRLVHSAVNGKHGLVAALNEAVAPNGRWHEGENYHFFALRGFQLAAEVLRGMEVDLYTDRRTVRFVPMYAAPLFTLLPDLTVPARGDSPYGVSICQPRYAELWEVARTRLGEAYDNLLTAMYGTERGPDISLEEIAELEVHRPAGVQRDQVGWKGLLWMRAEAPAGSAPLSLPSTVVEPRGPAVIRPRSQVYVAVESGTGSGHGHPDALHLTWFDEVMVLSDPGTGSYVAQSLHWYRSTLAHNAPGVAGLGQAGGATWCSAFDERDGVAWAQVTAEDFVGPHTRARRSVLVASDLVVDVVDVEVTGDTEVDLALHPRGAWSIPAADLAPVPGADHVAARGLETGYDVVDLVARLNSSTERIDGHTGNRQWSVLLPRREGETILMARAPGPSSPAFADGEPTSFLIRRGRGSGRWVTVLDGGRKVARVSVQSGAVAVSRRGDDLTIKDRDDGIEVTTSERSIRLAGFRSRPAPGVTLAASGPQYWCPALGTALPIDQSLEMLPSGAVHVLSERHYRRSETPYPGADHFSARVGIWVAGSRLYVVVDVRKAELAWWNPAADPELDNETPAIHADGVQLYWSMSEDTMGRAPGRGCVVLPQADGTVRVEPVRGVNGCGEVAASWMKTDQGYRVLTSFPHDRNFQRGERIRVNVVVNEMRPGRVRRAGQLALDGLGGWTYLRGDREPIRTAAVVEVR